MRKSPLAKRQMKAEYVDARILTLDQWMAYLELPEHKQPKHLESYCFPTDALRDQFIETIQRRSDRETSIGQQREFWSAPLDLQFPR